MNRALILAGAVLFAPGAAALANPAILSLPAGAEVTASVALPGTSYALAIGPWGEDGVHSLPLEGNRTDTAWRLRANQNTTLQILAPLREQLEAAGFSVIYQCDTDACGGFDFRYALDLLPEPSMHVDLGDFRYLAAARGPEHVALMVSRSSESAYVQQIAFSAQSVAPPRIDNPLTPRPETPGPAAEPDRGAQLPGSVGAALEGRGAVALDDLAFASGAATLEDRPYPSLEALAAYLARTPGAQVALVGHTDAVGGLAANVALSKKRAEAARTRLIERHGVTPGQISAEGAGWLAPRASNLTPEGRERNRRVEAVLTSAR